MIIEMTELAWAKTRAELDRVAPDEGLVVPLLALTAPGDHHPCRPLTLATIAHALVADVIVLPPRLLDNTRYAVRVLPSGDAYVAAQIRRRVRAQPRLRPIAHLHSHPFARGSTWPSGGDIKGHMQPQLAANARAGVDVSFSLIARDRWKLDAFAMDFGGEVIALGEVGICRDPALLRGARASWSRALCMRRQERIAALGAAFVKQDELFGGFHRIIGKDGVWITDVDGKELYTCISRA